MPAHRPLTLSCLLLPLLACGPTDNRPDADTIAAQRESCAFSAGALPADSTANSEAIGENMPIDTFVVIMQENRSFDHYFGSYEGDIDGITSDMTNPDANGDPVSVYHETDYCVEDVAHSWGASHTQYNEGANDGFVTTNDPGGARALGYFTRNELPYYYALMDEFAASDRMFCDLLGPTWPNSKFMLSGTSFGQTSNDFPPEGVTNIAMQFNERNLWWASFNDGVPRIGMYLDFIGQNLDHNATMDGFFLSVDQGSLPPLTFVDSTPRSDASTTNEHGPGNPQMGQAWVASIINAIMNGPQWESTAIILTYDEHGGYFDHVAPPAACAPDDLAPDASNAYEGFTRLGFRVPLIVISPYAKRGYISHQTTSLASIPRLIALRYDLPAMSKRDANANPLLDLFDFENPDFSVPNLPQAVVDADQQAACIAEFGGGK